jgi:hypothetical protein
MLSWLKTYWPVVVLGLMMIAVIDSTLSSLLTCHPVGGNTGAGADSQQAKENCTAFGGPVLATLTWIAEVSHKYEGLITAAFTVVLAVFTGRLWYSTEGLFRVTKTVADADRPHMIPAEMTISGLRQPPAEDGLIKTTFKYKFINYGRSPAFMKRFCLMVRIGADELEPIPSYGDATSTDFIIVVNGWWGSTESDPTIVSVKPDDAVEILSENSKMIVLGFIEYSDPASQPHKMRFAYRLSYGNGDVSTQFRPIGPDSYREYT